jgi:hypothetical protein
MKEMKETNNENRENEMNAAQCLFQYVETARQQVIVVKDKLVEAQIILLDQKLSYARIQKKLEETTKELDLLKEWKGNRLDDMEKNENDKNNESMEGLGETGQKGDYEMVDDEVVEPEGFAVKSPAVNLGCSKCRWNVVNGCSRCRNVNWKGVRAADRGQK